MATATDSETPTTRAGSAGSSSFDPTPSRRRTVIVDVVAAAPASADAVGVAVASKGTVPRSLGLDRATLAAAGFDAKVGQVFVSPRKDGACVVALGVGDGDLTTAQARDVAAAFGRAVPKGAALAIGLIDHVDAPAADAAQAIVEGVVLGRYRYMPLKGDDTTTPLAAVALIAGRAAQAGAKEGAARGVVTSAAASLARDLANTPPSHLTATRIANVATEVAAAEGLDIEVLGPDELRALGCGGLLGVNAGSTEQARLVKLTYRPDRKSSPRAKSGGPARLALVGKGVMYDSGGISLKPSDPMHAAMKMDMSGAAAVLSALSALRALNCPNEVTGYLMCTDNMPSGSAMKLGDVLHIHDGTTVEIHNTDAEGRLVLADGLALAKETAPDAIVDIATLTGACVVALGTAYAGVLGNDQRVIDRLRASGDAADEPLWQLPLETAKYRKLLDSDVADIKNIGGPYGGAITAAVFLSTFVGDTAWAHLDIAGPMKSDADDSWRSKGATGFGTRVLIDFATGYRR